MRILFSCVFGLGEFHPLVPLALAARAAGHAVAFATGENLRPNTERLGLTLFPVGRPFPTIEERRHLFAGLRQLTPQERSARGRREIFAGQWVEEKLADLTAAGAVREEMRALPAIETGIHLLEQLAAERQPILNRTEGVPDR